MVGEMAKKPTFLSGDAQKQSPPLSGDSKSASNPGATRVFRDPADARPEDSPAGSAKSGVVAPTRVLDAEPANESPSDTGPSPATRVIADTQASAVISSRATLPVVGWLVVIDGPGRGTGLPFCAGMNAIGRAGDNDIVLDFGDDDITYEPHAFVVFDEERRTFHATHAGKNGLVRLNDQPLLEATQIANGARLRIGKTQLQLATFCGPDFSWTDS